MQSKIIFCIITIAFSLSLIKSRGINVSPIEKREFFYPITEECITCLKSLGTFSEKAIKTISKQSTMSKSQILRIQYECRDKLMPDERIFAKQNDILRLLSRDNGVGECLKKYQILIILLIPNKIKLALVMEILLLHKPHNIMK